MKPVKNKTYKLVQNGVPVSYDVIGVSGGKYHFHSSHLGRDMLLSRASFNEKRYIPAVFIENDHDISEPAYEYMTTMTNRNPKTWVGFQEITRAEKNPRIVEAIEQSDIIFLFTCFIGSSESMLIKMCQMALAKGYKDKTIINLFSYRDVAWHIPEEAKPLIKELKKNNIIFLYEGDAEIKEIFS